MSNPNQSPKPANFDWVTVRHGCAVAPMFVFLKSLAERDVQKYNELAGGTLVSLLSRDEYSMFSVSRNRYGQNETVVFHETNNGIRVRAADGKETMLTLSLDDAADCKFLWDDVPLDPWQVLRRVLEPVLFPPVR